LTDFLKEQKVGAYCLNSPSFTVYFQKKIQARLCAWASGPPSNASDGTEWLFCWGPSQFCQFCARHAGNIHQIYPSDGFWFPAQCCV